MHQTIFGQGVAERSRFRSLVMFITSCNKSSNRSVLRTLLRTPPPPVLRTSRWASVSAGGSGIRLKNAKKKAGQGGGTAKSGEQREKPREEEEEDRRRRDESEGSTDK